MVIVRQRFRFTRSVFEKSNSNNGNAWSESSAGLFGQNTDYPRWAESLEPVSTSLWAWVFCWCCFVSRQISNPNPGFKCESVMWKEHTVQTRTESVYSGSWLFCSWITWPSCVGHKGTNTNRNLISFSVL